MPNWNDANGRTWTAHVSIGTAERLKAAGIDLLDPKQLGAIYQDPFALARLNAEIHRSQWETLKLTEGDFLSLSTDDEWVAQRSIEAMEKALSDFFRRMRRGALATVIEKASAAATETDRRQTALLQTPAADAAIAAEIDNALVPLAKALGTTLPTPEEIPTPPDDCVTSDPDVAPSIAGRMYGNLPASSR